MTDEQLNQPLSVQMFRQNGFCVKGTKEYGERLGLNFKDLMNGKLTVRDLAKHESDAFVKVMLKQILGK